MGNAVQKAQQGKSAEPDRKPKRGQQANPNRPEAGGRVVGGGPSGMNGPPSMEVSQHLQELMTPRDTLAAEDGAEAAAETASPRGKDTSEMQASYQSDFIDASEADASFADSM